MTFWRAFRSLMTATGVGVLIAVTAGLIGVGIGQLVVDGHPLWAMCAALTVVLTMMALFAWRMSKW